MVGGVGHCGESDEHAVRSQRDARRRVASDWPWAMFKHTRGQRPEISISLCLMDTPADPYELFDRWFAEAKETEPRVPEAVAVATADSQGRPSVRQVLLKAVDSRGFVFYTNLGSRKASEAVVNPFAAMNFHWKTQSRQVQVRGACVPVSNEEADAYFATRARASKIGAWASKQSQPMEGRGEFESRIAKYTARFGLGDVPRPPFWSGFRIEPDVIEFWEDRSFRLHLRHAYQRTESGWTITELYP